MRVSLLAGLIAASVPGLSLACATCGCTLSSDAAMGYSTSAGWQVNLEYSFINQDQLRSGTSTATPEQVVNNPAAPHADGGEIERGTISRYITASLIYRPNANWAFNLQVPYVDRTHSTYGDHDSPYTADALDPNGISNADASGLGDIKLISSYQGFLPTRNLGVQLGVKLPTGNYGGPSVNGGVVGHPTYFGNSGNAAGQPLDSSLQVGTGSTDLIVGAYYFQPVSQDFDAFINGQFQASVRQAMYHEGENFRPGNLGTLSTGLRYVANPGLVPQLQLNYSDKRGDQGALADDSNSAGKVLYVAPGLTAQIQNHVQVYAFVQLPVYAKLDGYQLFPHWTATGGVSYSF